MEKYKKLSFLFFLFLLMSELKKAGTYKPKKEIAKIDRKPRRKPNDTRCKLDKELNPRELAGGGNSIALNRKAADTQRSLQQLIKFNHSILEYMKKDQEIEEAYVLLEQHDAEPFSLYSDEVLTPEELTEDDLDATQVVDD